MNSTIITGIIIIACIILPIWYLIRSQSAGKRKLHDLLAAQGKGGNFEATEHESWGSKIIGIDREHGMVAFANLNDSGKKVYLADLKLFTRSFVEKSSGTNGSKGGESKLSNISIRFVAKEKGTEDVIFPLYSDHSDSELTNELHIADEWVDKINSSMKKK